MRRIRGQAFQRPDDHRFDPAIIHRARRTGTRLVAQPVDATCQEATAPFADRNRVRSDLRRYFLVLGADAQPNTIRARNAKACAVLRRLASDSSSARSDAVNSTIANRSLPVNHLL